MGDLGPKQGKIGVKKGEFGAKNVGFKPQMAQIWGQKRENGVQGAWGGWILG